VKVGTAGVLGFVAGVIGADAPVALTLTGH
jgi:hypothetical protein